jgi:hypothetical protein
LAATRAVRDGIMALRVKNTDRHAHDKAALQDDLDLGEVGEPDWRKQE